MNIYEALAKPFPIEQVSFRLGPGVNTNKMQGQALAYIDARAVMDRLDSVAPWQVRYAPIDKGMICEIGIKVDGEWLWRGDGADQTDIEAIKGGFSQAIRRAGVPWGIFRYAYDVGAIWVAVKESGKNAKGQVQYAITEEGYRTARDTFEKRTKALFDYGIALPQERVNRMMEMALKDLTGVVNWEQVMGNLPKTEKTGDNFLRFTSWLRKRASVVVDDKFAFESYRCRKACDLKEVYEPLTF